ncbi:MAG: sigma-70 family RNA polymerase sigma factor [Acidimicrobiales bacterium]
MTDLVRRRLARRTSHLDLERADLTAVLLRAREGVRAAETAFIRRTMPDVWRYCAHLIGEGHADDATQATYLRALRSMRTFRGESSAKTWLLGVARNTCLDELRSRGRRQRIVEKVEAQPHDAVQHDRDVVDRSHLASSVRLLDLDRREAFVLTQVLGYSYEEAASVLRCPVGTIRSRVARARQDLASTVGADEAPGPAVRRARSIG